MSCIYSSNHYYVHNILLVQQEDLDMLMANEELMDYVNLRCRGPDFPSKFACNESVAAIHGSEENPRTVLNKIEVSGSLSVCMCVCVCVCVCVCMCVCVCDVLMVGIKVLCIVQV